MDYLYWFVILGLSKLREGGRLGFITTSYWPTADGAAKLRKYILDNALVRETVNFGETRIFAGAPGQHNMIFVLERCGGVQKRVENRIKVARVKKEFGNGTVKERLKKLLEHLERHIEKESYSDEYVDIFVSPVRQGDLADGAWHLVYPPNLDNVLRKVDEGGQRIGEFLHVGCGVLTNRDVVSAKNIKRLSQLEIRQGDIKVGDGIFVLTLEEYKGLSPLIKEQNLIKPWYKNSEVSSYIPDFDEEKKFLVYIRNKDDLEEYPHIREHLLKYKGILDYQLTAYGETNKWYAVTRASEDSVLKKEKVFTPYRAERNMFAYSDDEFFSSKDLYYITYESEPGDIGESLKYVLAILNSSLLDVWCANNLKRKGSIREYYATPLRSIPIRRINFADPQEVKIHDHLVKLVDSIIEAKKNLANYNRFFPKVRLTRLQENEPLPEISDEEVVKSLESSVLRTIRTHPQIRYYPQTVEHFFLKGTKLAEDAQSLTVVSKDKQVLTLTAPQDVLVYLQKVLPNYQGKEWSEIINQILIPTEPGLANKKSEEVLSQVTSLRDEIKALQQEIDTIVFDLYGLNKEEQEIVVGNLPQAG